MTSLSVAFVLMVVLVGVLPVRRKLVVILAVGAIPASGAVLVTGSVVVPSYYAGCIVVCAAWLAVEAEGNRRPQMQGERLPLTLWLLLGFGFTAIVVTAVAPFLFNGVMSAAAVPARLNAGTLTTSNVAQCLYLVLNIGVVCFLWRSRTDSSWILGIMLGGGILLSLWRYGAVTFGLPFPYGVLDNSPTFAYIETAPGGIQRFRGIYSEPAALAGTAVAAAAWAWARMLQVGLRAKCGLLSLFAAAVFLGVVSTSTSFLVAGSMVLAVALLVSVAKFLSHRLRLRLAYGLASIGLVLVGIFTVPMVGNFVGAAVSAKIDTSSYVDRTASNVQLYALFQQTVAIGAGLGAGRGSSLAPTLLGTTGILGFILFGTAIFVLLMGAIRRELNAPAMWTLIAVLISKLVAGPDLSDTSGLLWVSIGLLVSARREFSVEEYSSDRSTTRAPRRVITGPATRGELVSKEVEKSEGWQGARE